MLQLFLRLSIQPILIIHTGGGKGSHDPICSPIVMSDSFDVAPHYSHVIRRTVLNDHWEQIELLSHRHKAKMHASS